MQTTITATVPAEIKSALEDVIKNEKVSSDELVGKAITEYLFLRRYRLLRERMIAHAQAQGIYTDQDIFDRVS